MTLEGVDGLVVVAVVTGRRTVVDGFAVVDGLAVVGGRTVALVDGRLVVDGEAATSVVDGRITIVDEPGGVDVTTVGWLVGADDGPVVGGTGTIVEVGATGVPSSESLKGREAGMLSSGASIVWTGVSAVVVGASVVVEDGVVFGSSAAPSAGWVVSGAVVSGAVVSGAVVSGAVVSGAVVSGAVPSATGVPSSPMTTGPLM